MSATKERLRVAIGRLSERQASVVLKFTQWLLDQADEFTEEEWAEIRAGLEEVRQGDVVRFNEVRRDV